MIYADNAATTKLDIDAFEAMKPFLLENYGNASQPYSFGVKAKKQLMRQGKRLQNVSVQNQKKFILHRVELKVIIGP